MLLAWLKQQGITQVSIARALETSKQSVSRWMRADTIPTWRHEQLVKFGIPAELLPVAQEHPGRLQKNPAENGTSHAFA